MKRMPQTPKASYRHIAQLEAKLQQPKKPGVVTSFCVLFALVILMAVNAITSHLWVFLLFSLAMGIFVVTSGQLTRYAAFLHAYTKKRPHKDITKSPIISAISKACTPALLKWSFSAAFFFYTLTFFINTQAGYHPTFSNIIFSFFGFLTIVTLICLFIGTLCIQLLTKKKPERAAWRFQPVPFTQLQGKPADQHIFKEDPVTKALQMGPNSPEYISMFGQSNDHKHY